MPKKVDFSSIVGGVKKKVAEKKLEREMRSFQKRPKETRKKESEEFDFKQVTNQIKKKVKPEPAKGFDPAAVEKALVENKPKKGKALPEKPKKATAKKPVAKTNIIQERYGIKRVPTGIPGLDELIEGGFEEGAAILIVGSAGTGKTLFALQFLYQGAMEHNEPGIYITFEEEKELLYKHSAAFGWNFEALEKKGLFKVLEYKPHHVEKIMQEGGGTIKDQIKAMGAKRLVIDSITAYALLFKDEYQKRENILDFFDMLSKWGCTSIIISELPPKLAEIKEGSVGFLTDAIISLYYSKDQEKGIRVHSCEILKMRGTKHTNKLLALGFEKNGIVIYPEVEVF